MFTSESDSRTSGPLSMISVILHNTERAQHISRKRFGIRHHLLVSMYIMYQDN